MFSNWFRLTWKLLLSHWQKLLEKQTLCTFSFVSLLIFQMSSFYRIPLLFPYSVVFNESLLTLNIHPREVQIPESMDLKDLSSSSLPQANKEWRVSTTVPKPRHVTTFYEYVAYFTLERTCMAYAQKREPATLSHRYISFNTLQFLIVNIFYPTFCDTIFLCSIGKSLKEVSTEI